MRLFTLIFVSPLTILTSLFFLKVNFDFSNKLLNNYFSTSTETKIAPAAEKKELEDIIKKIIEENKKTGDPKKIDQELIKILITFVTQLLKTFKPDVPHPTEVVTSLVQEFLEGLAHQAGEKAGEALIDKITSLIFPPNQGSSSTSFFKEEVHFEFNEYTLQTAGLITIGRAIEFFSQNQSRTVIIYCYADRVGQENPNLKLSQKRCKAIRDILVDAHISDARIIQVTFGESQHHFHTLDEVQETENRVAEINIY